MIGSDTVGRRRWSRSVRFQGRQADSGEMAVRGACDREIRPSRLMFFLSPIVEVQPGNVNVANFYSSEAQHRPGELPTPESGTGGPKKCVTLYMAHGWDQEYPLVGHPARGAALNSYDKREIRGIEPGGAHHRTTEYHEPEPEWGESPHHPRRKLTRQA